jgi:RND family efflux transporter MFP subunit
MNEQNKSNDIASLRIAPDKKHDDRPRRRWWLWPVILITIAAAVLIYMQVKQKVVAATIVRVATVDVLGGSDAAAELVATGYVVAQRKAEVASKGTGRLVFLGFEEGDRVKSGEVIARIDNDDIRAGLDMAKAELERTKVDTLNIGRQFRRHRELFQSGAISDVEFETAETTYKSSLTRLLAAEAAVRVQEVNLENTYIRAPFDGTVLTKNADIGEVVAPFASSASSKGSVVTMADMTSLEVEADVSESNIYKVIPGQPCEIVLDAYPATRYQGFVKKIVPTADRARATVLTKIAFREQDARVLPEMSARVIFLPPDSGFRTAEATVLVAPRETITSRDGAAIVFRVEGEYVAAVPVTTGRSLGGVTEIVSGLSRGDRVVISPPGKMQTGEKVEVK